MKILNSIIADQQNKIVELEKKLQLNATKIVAPAEKSSENEPKVP